MSRRPNIELKEKILCSAYKLMYKNGFKGMSMDDVAREASIKKANLFHYFPTKESLGLAVFDHAVQGFQEKIAASLGESVDPVAAVTAMFDDAMQGMQDKGCCGGCFVGNMAQELSDYNENLRNKVSEHLTQWTRLLSVFLEKRRQEGYFRPELNPTAVAQAILSLFEGAMLMCKANRNIHPLESARSMAVSYLQAVKS